jgi:hypothetical protein
MKKLLVALCVTCALVLTVQAQDKDKEKKGDKKTPKQEMLDKYDTNKDGKLDKDERAKVSAEDKEKMKEGRKKKKES